MPDPDGLNVETQVDFESPIRERRTVTTWPVTGTSDEASLVMAARAGDRGAFGRLYDLYARMVHGILLARVPFAEVDDLLQDVFLLALGRLQGLREIGSFGPWLATIARNRAHDYHRRSHEVRESTENLREEEGEGAAPRPSSGEGDAKAILQTIRHLPEAYQETLILRLVEGMTGPEIAARTGLTPGSVRVNLHRGMERLREKLGSGDRGSEKSARRSRTGSGSSG